MSESIPYVVGLIEREGFYVLAGNDGCACGFIELRGVKIEVHCHRSGCDVCERDGWRAGVHVYSDSMEYDDATDFPAIAEAVERQVSEMYVGAYNVSFTDREGTER